MSQLAKRAERRAEAEKGLTEAQEKGATLHSLYLACVNSVLSCMRAGDVENAERFQKRLVSCQQSSLYLRILHTETSKWNQRDIELTRSNSSNK